MPHEIVPHENNFAPQLAEYFDSIDGVHDPVLRRDYLSQMDSTDFIGLIQRTASIVRTGNSEVMQSFDGGIIDVDLNTAHDVPDQRDKEGILREAWSIARHFLRDPTISDENALEYAALVVANGIVLTHPFADANGRTSRVLSYVISTGDTSETAFHELLGEYQKLWKTTQPNILTHAFDPAEAEKSGEDAALDRQSVAYALQERAEWRRESAEHIQNYLRGLKDGELGPLRWATEGRMTISEGADEQEERYRQLMAEEVAKRAVGSYITPIDEAVVVHRVTSRFYRDKLLSS